MYADAIVEALNAKHAETHYTFEVASRGRKYTKIAQRLGENGGRSVYMFIDNATGAWLKSAGWNAPAKGVRYAPVNEAEALALVADVADAYGAFLYVR